ncbi:MFS transporter [Allokutzneria sp. A3M-2-11 16]|uniref:MFS transporter n=1 Tax=Allokutzneria sp. A3M-2-11 16 TaxID=2962043 RepID=UPI0020B76A53|nr:MFS transporter [Allokutzneria sp. A3M-2-11 16]MCP3801880.1 MFS transporter [Allokutzneria sp. A3M-2-11 16]
MGESHGTSASLRGHRDFRHLWAADAVSQTGTQFADFAIPVLAVVSLGATPFQVGLLDASHTIAFLLISLPAGAYLDRMRKRPVMQAANLLRALALVVIPIAYFAGFLSFGVLLASAAVVGLASVLFDTSYAGYLLPLVGSERLTAASSRLQATNSVAQIGGPAAAAQLMRIVAAPVVLLFTALSFVVSTLLLSRITMTETIEQPKRKPKLWPDIVAGLSLIKKQPVIRSITVSTFVLNALLGAESAVLAIYVLRDLSLGAGALGMFLSAGAVGGLLGATFANRISERVGSARVVTVSALLFAPAFLLLAISGDLTGLSAILVGASLFLRSFAVVLFNICSGALRQRTTPKDMLSRVAASNRFITWGIIPVGSLAGGLLGESLGAHGVLWTGALASLLIPLPILLSPLRKLRTFPNEWDVHTS